MKEKVTKKKKKKSNDPLRVIRKYRHASSINEHELINMCKVGCTLDEMATILDCSVQTLETHFGDLIRKHRQDGKACLRRKQFQVAMSGNPTMLIWLGKHKLGQKEDRSENVYLPDVKKMLSKEEELYVKEKN